MRLECPEEPLPVWVDAARIAEVLDNLLSNAIKYWPEGGEVLVRVCRQRESVTVTVVDCGIGIRQLQNRLGQAGLQMADIDAIFITHEHSDHVGCAQTLALRHRIPVWMSRGTHAALGARKPFSCATSG